MSLELGPAQKRVLADEVADVLRAAILDGRLAPGQAVREEQVAEKMQVSRGPVREALARLEREGLVYKKRNRGTFVARLSLKDVEEVFSLRQALESLAVQYFTRNSVPQDLTHLEAIVDRMSQCVASDASVQEVTDLDIQFHEWLVRRAGHQRLLEAWLNLREQFRIALLSRNIANQDYRDMLLDHHRILVEALRNGDAERTQRLAVEHIGKAYERLIRTYPPEGGTQTCSQTDGG
jgi:DNA-binding GntR family transcriptional regulator